MSFLLCSFCLHGTLLLALGSGHFFEYGMAPVRATEIKDSLVMAILQPAERPEREPLNIHSTQEALDSRTPLPTGSLSKSDSRTTDESTQAIVMERHIGAAENEIIEIGNSEKEDGLHYKAKSIDDYAIAAQLTRLPQLLSSIDLNVPSMNESTYHGKISLRILINADGTVDEVLTSIDTEQARDFADRVATQFQNARFKPGEVRGRAVKSQLQITVVKENLENAARTTH